MVLWGLENHFCSSRPQIGGPEKFYLSIHYPLSEYRSLRHQNWVGDRERGEHTALRTIGQVGGDGREGSI